MIGETELKQFRSLQREISIEEDRLAELQVSQDQSSETKYLMSLIAENKARCLAQVLKIQEFINSIDDSEMRVIFTQRYIKSRTWLQIAFLTGQHNEQIPRKRHDRYLENRRIIYREAG